MCHIATNHIDKFVSGGVQAREESDLLTQAGLHPGSPRWQPAPAPWQAAGRQQPEEPMVGPPAPQPTRRPDDDGPIDFVYGEAAESLAFSSEEMDA